MSSGYDMNGEMTKDSGENLVFKGSKRVYGGFAEVQHQLNRDEKRKRNEEENRGSELTQPAFNFYRRFC